MNQALLLYYAIENEQDLNAEELPDHFRDIDAKTLREAIRKYIDKYEDPARHRGLHLSGFTINGNVDLSHLNIPTDLSFRKCNFTGHISFVRSEVRSLNLSGSIIESFDGFGMSIKGNLYMGKGFVSKGTIRLINARIGTRLSFRGGYFQEGNLLNFNPDLDHLPPVGSIDACNLFVGGSLYMDNDPENKSPYYDDCIANLKEMKSRDGETIDRRKFCSYGLITLRGAHISGRWYCGGTVKAGYVPDNNKENKWIDSSTEAALDWEFEPSLYIQKISSIEAYCIRVDDSIQFKRDFKSNGMLRLSGARIGGKVSFKTCHLSEISPTPEIRRKIINYSRTHSLPRGALDLFGASVGGSVYFDGGIKSSERSVIKGLIGFKNATIEGRLVFRNSLFVSYNKTGNVNPRKLKLDYEDYTFDLSISKIKGNLLFRSNSQFIGTFRLKSANIGGRVRISPNCNFQINNYGKVFQNLGDPKLQHVALDAAAIKVGADFSIKAPELDSEGKSHGKPPKFLGMLNMAFSEIGTEIVIASGDFRCAASDKWKKTFEGKVYLPPMFRKLNWWAINAENVSTTAVFLARGRRSENNSLPISVPIFTGRVVLHHATIKGVLDTRGLSEEKINWLDSEEDFSNWRLSEIHLENAKCETLKDNSFSPIRFRYNNFHYSNIDRSSLPDEYSKPDKSATLSVEQRCERLRERYGDNERTPFQSQPYEQLAYTLDKCGKIRESHYALTKKKWHHFKSFLLENKPLWSTNYYWKKGDKRKLIPFALRYQIYMVSSLLGFGTMMATRAIGGLICLTIITGVIVAMDIEGAGTNSKLVATLHVMKPPGFELLTERAKELLQERENIWLELLGVASKPFWVFLAWGLFSSFSSRKPNV